MRRIQSTAGRARWATSTTTSSNISPAATRSTGGRPSVDGLLRPIPEDEVSPIHLDGAAELVEAWTPCMASAASFA